MDLLRVISHHRARLATPIRTVQKIYSEAADLENVPFSETMYSPRSGAATNRPLLLIEPSYKINGDDKAKVSSRPARPLNEEKEAKQEAVSTSGTKPSDAGAGSMDDKKSTSPSGATSKPSTGPISNTQTQNNLAPETSEQSSIEKPEIKGEKKDLMGLNSKDTTPRVTSPKRPSSASEPGSEKAHIPFSSSQNKQDGEKLSASSVTRPPLEENIVLGVALEGSKRTLPIDEDLDPSPFHSPADSKEMATQRNGSEFPPNSKDIKDGQMPAVPSATKND